VPAFGLVVGSTSDPPTVGIAGVEAPPEIIIGRPSPLTVTVRQGARSASRGVVRVSEDGRELARAPFQLAGPGASARVAIPVTLTARGKRFLTVELLDVAGDPMRGTRRLVAVTASRPSVDPCPPPRGIGIFAARPRRCAAHQPSGYSRPAGRRSRGSDPDPCRSRVSSRSGGGCSLRRDDDVRRTGGRAAARRRARRWGASLIDPRPPAGGIAAHTPSAGMAIRASPSAVRPPS
jgi:hypothetical protein